MNFEIPDINKIRKELDEKNAEMEKKERERIKEEYERLSEQKKPTEEKPEEKIEEKVKTEEEKPSAAKAMEGKEEEPKEEKGEKEELEEKITGNFYDELKKIKDMPDKAEGFNKTAKLKMKKTEKCFELIDSWKDLAYLDNYKGIKNIFSELDKLKPSIFLYNLKRAQAVNKIGLTMALNYKEWDLEDKEKLKIIKNFVNKQSKEKDIFYQKDKTLKEIAEILASKDIPYKDNVDIIVKNIENPDIKAKTIEEMADIEKETIEEKKQLLKEVKERMAKEKVPSEEKVKEQLEKFGFDKEAVSKVLPELVKFFENPEANEKVQKLINTKEFQVLRKTIEKITKQKEEVPDSVVKAKEHIEKKESPWGTAFGAAGWFVTLILMLFIGLLMKGEDYLIGQAVGGKKKEKK